MNLKNQNINFIFTEVKDKKILEKVFSFRYKVITKTKMFQEYVKDTDFANNQETDMYDPYSEHFAALDKHGNICATVRLIHHSKHGYPTENSMEIDSSNFEKKHLGEISRIFIDPIYRNHLISKIIMNKLNELLYIKMIELDIRYTYGALEPRFIRLLKMNNMNYEILSPLQNHGKMGLRHPCILYTKDLGDNNPEFIKALREKNE